VAALTSSLPRQKGQRKIVVYGGAEFAKEC